MNNQIRFKSKFCGAKSFEGGTNVTVVTKDSLINENLKILKIVEKQRTSKNNQKSGKNNSQNINHLSFYPILSYFILFYSILSSILSYFILFYPILSFILSYFILFYPLFYSLFYPYILFYFLLFSLVTLSYFIFYNVES